MNASKIIIFLLLLITLTIGSANAYPHKFNIVINPTSVNVKVNEQVKIDVYITYNGCKCHCHNNHGGYYGECKGNKFNITMVTWSSEPSIDSATFKFDNESGHWIWTWTPEKSGTYYVTFSATLERYCGCHKSWTVSRTAIVVVSGGTTSSTTKVNPALMVKYSADSGVVGKPANVTINLTAIREDVKTIPADVVLVIDSSESMDRYGTVIAGPKEVTITDEYQKVGEFTVEKDGATVEIDLQTPRDDWGGYVDMQIYYNGKKCQFCVELVCEYDDKHKHSKHCECIEWTDTLTFDGDVKISGLSKGKYEVYAKKHSHNANPHRIFMVELPPQRIDMAKEASKKFVDMLSSDDRVAVATFPRSEYNIINNAKILQHLTYDKDSAKYSIDYGFYLGPGGGTPMGDGIKVAIEELDKYGRKDATKAIILFTDGWWNEGINPLDEAQIAKEKGYKIYTIGCGGANQTALKQIAEITGGKFYYATDEDSLIEIYKDIAKSITIVAKNVSVSLTFTNNVTFNGNVGGSYTWNVGELAKNESASLTLTIVPQNTGYVKVADGELRYEYDDKLFEQKFEIYANYTNNPPQIEVKNKHTVKEGSTLKFTVEAIDPDNHSVQITNETPLPDNASFDGHIFTWTPSYDFVSTTEGSKNVTVTFKATDEYGASTTKTVTITVNNVNRAPILMVTPESVTIYEGNSTTINVSATDPDGDNVTVYWSSNELGVTDKPLTGDNWTYYFDYDFVTHPDKSRNITVTFKAVDNYDRYTTKTVVITVKDVNRATVVNGSEYTTDNNVNRAPAIKEIDEVEPEQKLNVTSVTINESETIKLKIMASDPDNDSLTLTWSCPKLHVSNSKENITDLGNNSWTWSYDNLSKETYHIEFTVSDGNLTDNATITINVIQYNPPYPKLSMNLVVTGKGPYVGDVIHIYVINETAVGPAILSKLKGGIKLFVNVTNATSDYNININVNGKKIYSSGLGKLTTYPYYIDIPFVPMTAGIYNVSACVPNSTVKPVYQPISVGIKPATS